MARILLIGQHGQVSRSIQAAVGQEHELLVLGREQLDLSQPATVQAGLAQHTADLIINPAAYTAVDLAEQESELAFTINRDAVAEIAAFCAAGNTPLIHFSTDYVFDGSHAQPYVETDTPAPSGVYGQSKLAGEQAVLTSDAPALILRTSWVYSNYGKNFYKTMLALSESRDELSVVADQIGSPTWAGSIAEVCLALVARILQQGQLSAEQQGVYHFTCQGEASWCDFAREIFRLNAVGSMTVNAITTAEYPTPAKRPAYSVLDNQRLEDVFGLRLPHWQNALRDCVAQTHSDKSGAENSVKT